MGCACAKSADVEDPKGPPKSATAATPKKAQISDAEIARKVAQAKTTGVLAFRECGLKKLPANATGEEMASLRMVDLTANCLKILPEAIGSWSGLQKLTCAENNFAELPASIGQLVSLQTLSLSKNCLSSLPVELNQLGKLKILKLDDNKLGKASLPEDVFGQKMSASLQELDLSGNELEELPPSVVNCIKLERLSLDRNRLTALPSELGRLKNLQYLHASANSLTALPDNLILELTSLSDLWLQANPIDRLKLQEIAGFDAFLERRKQKLDHKIETNVVGRVNLAVCGLE